MLAFGGSASFMVDRQKQRVRASDVALSAAALETGFRPVSLLYALTPGSSPHPMVRRDQARGAHGRPSRLLGDGRLVADSRA